MKSIVRYIAITMALFAIGCHGDVNDLVVENVTPAPDDNPTETNGLVLSVDKNTIEADGSDYVTFSLTLDGQELTANDATLANVYFKHEKSGTRLERYATTFSAVKNGDYSFVATYKGQQSANSVQVKAVNREKYEPYGQKIMVYDLTGAWCSYCPAMTAGLANVDQMWKSNMIVLAVHNGDQWAIPTSDGDLAQTMLSRFGGQGYPNCVYDLQYLNGKARSPIDIAKVIEQHITNYPATCGVKIESTKLEGTTLTIEAAMTSATGGEYELGYAILLDNQYYSGGTATDGIYSDIVINTSDNFLAMTNSKITTVANIERTKTFTIKDFKRTDVDNIRVVVFALTKINGKVMVDNANLCQLGQSADYMAVEHYNGIPEQQLTITADKSAIVANGSDAVTFTVKYGAEDVSRSKTMNIIYTYNGEEIELTGGVNSFTTTVAGEYKFKARYYKGGDIYSQEEVVVVASSALSEGAQNFCHKLLGVQFTSVGCQNCPTLSSVIKSIQTSQPDRLVPVSFHIDYNVADPMRIAMGDTYYKALKGIGLPMFNLDLRGESLTASRSAIETEMENRMANYPPTCGVAITTSYDAETRSLTIIPRIKSNTASSYRYIVMLVEDGIEYEQYGVTGSYTHNNVVRAVLSDNVYGAKFNGGTTLVAGVDTPLQSPIKTTLGAVWKVENMRVVVCALSTSDNGSTYYCNNTNQCALGKSVDYQLESGNGGGDDDEVADVAFNRHAAVLEFTGTWCAMCPSGYLHLKYLIEDYWSHDVVHILAFHDSTSDDPMGIKLTNTIFNKFSLGGFPGFVVDMRDATTEKVEIEHMIIRSFEKYPATCGIKLTSSCSGGNGRVEAELYAAKSGTYRLAVYILEDGIVYPQNNNGSYDNKYVHNHVVRSLVSSIYEGDRVGDIKAGQKATKGYDFTLNSGWNADKCTICALVIDSNGYVTNAAVCPINGSVNYDYKK